jgi:CheY-like chemotaxis protein
MSVKDSGIGIPTEQLASIFELFAQVDRSLERTHGGLGIGLTLVKQLVEMHQGRVEARSDGVGFGSEFLVRLPIIVEMLPLQHSPRRAALKQPEAPRRILVVDDNRDSAASLAMLLQIDGHETHMASDGEEAVALAKIFRPDVVLLDIGLPKLNGFEVCRRIRQHLWAKDMTLIALTGWGQDEDRRKAKDAGFDHHMVKPVDYAALTNLLAELSPAPV